MAVDDYSIITLSYPTTGETGAYIAAATAEFFTRDYHPPVQGRSTNFDEVHNKNGYFRHLYDNGPNGLTWKPFTFALEDAFTNRLGSATVQYQNLLTMWEHVGVLTMGAPDGVYSVFWAPGQAFEPDFVVKPKRTGDKIEYNVAIQFEEA